MNHFCSVLYVIKYNLFVPIITLIFLIFVVPKIARLRLFLMRCLYRYINVLRFTFTIIYITFSGFHPQHNEYGEMCDVTLTPLRANRQKGS